MTDRVAKVEERAGRLPAAVFAGETSYQPDIDRIQVCFMSYFINILVQFFITRQHDLDLPFNFGTAGRAYVHRP